MDVACSDLEVQETQADRELASRLQVEKGAPITSIRRIIVVDGSPAAYMADQVLRTWLRASEVDGCFNGSVLDLLRQKPGLHIGQALARIIATEAKSSLARKLGISPRRAVLLLEETLFDTQGCRSDSRATTFCPRAFSFRWCGAEPGPEERTMKQVLGLRCTICGTEYATDQVEYVCPQHGDDGIVDVVYDYRLIRQQLSPGDLARNPKGSMWRYLPLLPVDPEATRALVAGTTLDAVGGTPLYPAPRLAAELSLHHLWIKDDGRQPTASFKDRASAIAVCKTREFGYGVVTTASTGNAAAALAGLCAAVLQPSVIFVPRTAPPAKVAQLLVYGARVLLVDGTYDDAFELCLQAAREFGWYNRNTAYNPYMSEGKRRYRTRFASN